MAYIDFAWLFFTRKEREHKESPKTLADLLQEHRPDIAEELAFTTMDPSFARPYEVFSILQRIKALW